MDILANKTETGDDTLETGSIEQGPLCYIWSRDLGTALISVVSSKTLTVSQTVQNRIGGNKLIMNWKLLVRYIFSLFSSTYYPQRYMRKLRKTTKYQSQDRYSQRAHPEYMLRACTKTCHIHDYEGTET